MRKRNYYLLPLLSVLVFAVACGEPIPIKEMVAARKSITKALSVKADKYAPEELEKAKTGLFQAHDQIKKEDMDKAKISAEESNRAAVEAYDKSIPLLAKDTIEVSEQSIAEAVEANAEQLARPEYDEAVASLENANNLYENKQFYESYEKALDADSKAKNARNVALGKKEVLGDAIAEVKITLQKADDYNADTHAPENKKLAQENLEIAQQSFDELKLKKGFAAVEVAKINADEAYLKALERTAHEELANAETLIEKASQSDGALVAVDELSAAKESHKNAKEMLAESRYKESIDYSKEAARLSGIVLVTKKAGDTGDVIAKNDTTNDTNQVDKDKSDDDQDYFLYTVVYRERLKDCLWRIADRYYKDPWQWKKIYNANRDKIKDPDLIYPGWVLKVPKLAK